VKIRSAAILSTTLLLCLTVPALAIAAEPPPPQVKMMVYYLVLLYRGAAWTPEETPATRQLQEEHMANIRRLAKEGKLILAGPFEEDTDLRGLFLLKAASLAEARELCASDPAVKAGRLRPEIHSWWGPAGIRAGEEPKEQP
jgi:uncharacterized protein YciI